VKKLIQLELKRFTLKPHLLGLVIANIVILFLSIITSTFLTSETDASMTGLPTMQLDTITMATMLVRAMLIVWEAVLISSLIIEEYRSKTISLLFTYPVNRKQLIIAKVLLICGIMLAFHIGSSIFQNISISLLSGQMDFITYSFESLSIQIITTISTILLGLFPWNDEEIAYCNDCILSYNRCHCVKLTRDYGRVTIYAGACHSLWYHWYIVFRCCYQKNDNI